MLLVCSEGCGARCEMVHKPNDQTDQAADQSTYRRKYHSDQEKNDVTGGSAIGIIRDVTWHEKDHEEPDQAGENPENQSS